MQISKFAFMIITWIGDDENIWTWLQYPQNNLNENSQSINVTQNYNERGRGILYGTEKTKI